MAVRRAISTRSKTIRARQAEEPRADIWRRPDREHEP